MNRRAIPVDGGQEHLESLESRALFSAPYDFALVGVRLDATSPAVFEMLGELGADGAVTGTQTFARVSGSATSGPIDFGSFQLLAGGRLSTTPRTGVEPYESQVGSNFLAEGGFPLGSFFGQFGNDGPSDIAFMVQREMLDDGWINDYYEFQYLEVTADGISIHAGVFLINDTTVSWSDSPDASGAIEIGIDPRDEFGAIHMADGRAIHAASFEASRRGLNFSTLGAQILIVDTDNADGKIGIGIGRLVRTIDDKTGLHGVQRANILTQGALAQQFFSATTLAGGVASARVAIEMDYTGDYRIYDLGAYDTGDRTVLSSGTWVPQTAEFESRIENVVLTADATGAKAYFSLNADFVMLPYLVSNADGSLQEPLFGVATTLTPHTVDRLMQGGHVALNDDGHPIFYTAIWSNSYYNGTEQWYSQDLVELWGGKPLAAVESSHLDGFRQTLVLGVATDGDALSWERMDTGRWIFRNLSQELAAAGLVSDLAIFQHSVVPTPFVGPISALAVAGKNAGGEIVMYTPVLEFDESGVHPWEVINISQDFLTPFGQNTPEWVGGIRGYQTTWGGLNLVGLDADGELIVAWTAPGVNQWFTTNVSELAGTPALTGSITIIMTPWSGIHIHALDSTGALHVTWWVPGFAGDWAHNNLTEELDGPAFDTSRDFGRNESVTSFIGTQSNFNIVGFDENGRVRVYWWSHHQGWFVGDITNSFPPSEAPQGFSSADLLGNMNSLNAFGQSLYGHNEDGTFSRVWWAFGDVDTWNVQNLTDIALPLGA